MHDDGGACVLDRLALGLRAVPPWGSPASGRGCPSLLPSCLQESCVCTNLLVVNGPNLLTVGTLWALCSILVAPRIPSFLAVLLAVLLESHPRQGMILESPRTGVGQGPICSMTNSCRLLDDNPARHPGTRYPVPILRLLLGSPASILQPKMPRFPGRPAHERSQLGHDPDGIS